MHPGGFLEVITGPMFAGKTTELIKRIERQMFAKRKAALFKPAIDNRYSEDEIVAHNGLRYEAFVIPTDEEGVRTIGEITKRENFVYLTAVCTVCGRPATRSQRLIDGKPAPRDSPVILVGGRESYEARCRLHHEVP